MDITVYPHRFGGRVRIPASKSHTIRALFIASMAEGVSTLDYPLDSLDTRSCIAACRKFGAEIEEIYEDGDSPDRPRILRCLSLTGTAGGKKTAGNAASEPVVIDVGNSGTTLFFSLAFAALGNRPVLFTGDAQTAKRSAAPLLDALAALGARVESRAGCIPITVCGPVRGGAALMPCPTSQYLSALLLALPLCPVGTGCRLTIPVLNELPYIRMTYAYLAGHLRYDEGAALPVPPILDGAAEPADTVITITGGGKFLPYNSAVSGDFSSAAFPACAANISGGTVAFDGARLDFDDEQGDKVFFDFLQPGRLPGTLDLNATPDLLPITAVLACYRSGETRLVNVAHARIKETDRIAVMCAELSKLGADIAELPDGLVIRGGKKLTGGVVDGHGDHRVVMSLAVAALGAAGPVTIRGAEAADVTYPGFLDMLT